MPRRQPCLDASAASAARRVAALAAAAMLTLGGCASGGGGIARQLDANYPDARFEGWIRGCAYHDRVGNRSFGHDARAAVLWGRQVVGAAQALPCEVVIEAVVGASHQAAYRVWRDAAGGRREDVVTP